MKDYEMSIFAFVLYMLITIGYTAPQYIQQDK